MMHHYPNDDKENADPRNHGHGNKGFTSRPLSPGKRKRTPEEKLARPPLRDITGVPGITPTFVLDPPAFAIAADAAEAQQQQQHQQQQQSSAAAAMSTTTSSSTRTKKPAPAASKASSTGDGKPGKKPGAGSGAGAGAGGSMLSGPPLRPLR